MADGNQALAFLERNPRDLVLTDLRMPELSGLELLGRIKEAYLKFPPALLPYFTTHRWPGNVRELENVIERLVVLAPGEEITVNDLPEFLRQEKPALDAIRLELPPEGISLEAVEKELILRALQKFNWNQTKAAEYLDISRKVLIHRMEKFDLRKDG